MVLLPLSIVFHSKIAPYIQRGKLGTEKIHYVWVAIMTLTESSYLSGNSCNLTVEVVGKLVAKNLHDLAGNTSSHLHLGHNHN